MDGDVNVAFAPITDEVATFNLSRPSLGRHALTAVYAGDSQFPGGASPPVELSIVPAPAIISVSPPPFRHAGRPRR
jgi:hypothetical protein